jgi:hypothetical protein
MVVVSKTLEAYKTLKPRSFHTMKGTKAPLLSLWNNKRGRKRSIRRRSKTVDVKNVPPLPHMADEEHQIAIPGLIIPS